MLDYLCQYKYITSLNVEAGSALNLEQSNARPHCGWCSIPAPLHQTAALPLAGNGCCDAAPAWCHRQHVYHLAGSIASSSDVASAGEWSNTVPDWRLDTEEVETSKDSHHRNATMREIVHIQAGQCGNQIGAKVKAARTLWSYNLCSRKKKSRLMFKLNTCYSLFVW